MIARFDVRVLGDLCSDTGTRLTQGQLVGNAVLQAALDDGAGQIDLACQVGQRYTQAQLAALAAGPDSGILYRLNCDLAMTFLVNRRGVGAKQFEDAYKRSAELLELLRKGEAIFNVPSDVDSGTPAESFPSYQDYETVQSLRTAARGLFPLRRKQQVAIGG